MDIERLHYIVVEGPVGVGKTSLARRLAERWQAQLLMEQPDENPFLTRFYQDPARFALPVQLFFLFQRVNQLRDLKQIELFRTQTVADFMFDKDPLFARLNLSDDEFKLYRQIHDAVRPQTPQPDLVIYLQARPDVLIERVRRRNHPAERTVNEDYLGRLIEAYSGYFHQYSSAPVLMVNADRFNFVDDAADFDLLLHRIRAMRSKREFFNRGG